MHLTDNLQRKKSQRFNRIIISAFESVCSCSSPIVAAGWKRMKWQSLLGADVYLACLEKPVPTSGAGSAPMQAPVRMERNGD